MNYPKRYGSLNPYISATHDGQNLIVEVTNKVLTSISWFDNLSFKI